MCQTCHEDLNAQNVPPLKMARLMHDLPCPIHGHPADIRPALRAWVDFWNVVAPYTSENQLPFELIDKICKEYGILFTEAFEKLSWILKVMNGQNNRNQSGNSEDEK